MKLDEDIFAKLSQIPWFSKSGEQSSLPLEGQFRFVADKQAAFSSLLTQHWKDVRLEAQGDLTGYLAKRHSNVYGGHWNRLATEARQRLLRSVVPAIQACPIVADAPAGFIESVTSDLVRIVMEVSYARHRPPTFFRRLLAVYQSGYIPCGWYGGFDEWPTGTLLVH